MVILACNAQGFLRNDDGLVTAEHGELSATPESYGLAIYYAIYEPRLRTFFCSPSVSSDWDPSPQLREAFCPNIHWLVVVLLFSLHCQFPCAYLLDVKDLRSVGGCIHESILIWISKCELTRNPCGIRFSVHPHVTSYTVPIT